MTIHTFIQQRRFYQALKTGNAKKAEALRQAQLALMSGNINSEEDTKKLRHPYYWAPFILIGNGL